MDEDERTRRKRTRDGEDLAPDSNVGQVQESVDSILEHSLKKVRISKQFAGGIRLQQDVGECAIRSRELGVDYMKIDPKNPLHLMLRLSMNRIFSVTVGKYYPHHPPTICTSNGERVSLPVLEHWVPINTLSDVISQLNNAAQPENKMQER